MNARQTQDSPPTPDRYPQLLESEVSELGAVYYDIDDDALDEDWSIDDTELDDMQRGGK